MGGKLVKSGLLGTGKMAVAQEEGEGGDRTSPSLLRINTQKIPLDLISKKIIQGT